MPSNKNPDLFKPQQLAIPGVSTEKLADRKDEGAGLAAPPIPVYVQSRMHLLWIGLTLVCVLGVCYFAWRRLTAVNQGASSMAAQPPPEIVVDKPKPMENLPVGPGAIATKSQLARVWSARRFYFRDPMTLQTVSAMIVHLPDGAFWGFSLREPFGNCEMEYVTDLSKLEAKYGFSADHPMVGDPCNGTVFDLARYGSGPNGLVRGEIEKGPGLRPPVAIEIQERGDEILAVRMEQ